MTRPVFVKLGGSVLTDKAKPGAVKRAVARRLLAEIAKAQVPVVLFHGAGSYGHPVAKAAGLDKGPLNPDRRRAVAQVLAAVSALQSEVLAAAERAAMPAVPVPVHLDATAADGILQDLPVGRVQGLVEDGFVPVLSGTLVRDEDHRWRVVSADELMAELAVDLDPRLTVFATDVDGVLRSDGSVIESVASVDEVPDLGSRGADVTDAMRGKVRHGLAIAETCPVLILNGSERGRLGDAVKGKATLCTRLAA